MALTEKGKIALELVKKHCTDGQPFSAKKLSSVSGTTVAAATLTGLVSNGFLVKLGGSPVEYKIVDNFDEVLKLAEEIENRPNESNKSLKAARRIKNDEFYTQYSDIEKEVMNYRKYFKNKIVYLPCDDPANKKSKFWDFFVNNFDSFNLQKLIATHYEPNGQAYKIWIDGDTTGKGYVDDEDAMQEDLLGDGDFRSPECGEILAECDIVVTNPPFSLFREFVPWILSKDKEFLVIGSENTFTYKETFPLIKANKFWTGYNKVKEFITPAGTQKFGNICWFTNLPTKKRSESIILTKEYAPELYPKYDNYDAINIDKVVNTPKDYYDKMGVPVTFLEKYCPDQFEIVGLLNSFDLGIPYVDGKAKYARIVIKRKTQ